MNLKNCLCLPSAEITSLHAPSFFFYVSSEAETQVFVLTKQHFADGTLVSLPLEEHLVTGFGNDK